MLNQPLLSSNNDQAQSGRMRRAVRTLAGLLSAGVLCLGALLLIMKFVAPAVWGRTGIDRADGPQWWRIAVHVAVGALGEVLRVIDRRWNGTVRLATEIVVVVLCLGALGLAWWW